MKTRKRAYDLIMAGVWLLIGCTIARDMSPTPQKPQKPQKPQVKTYTRTYRGYGLSIRCSLQAPECEKVLHDLRWIYTGKPQNYLDVK